ncbi:hypothetical protein L7F22_032019 [Adiantum nelumboides]|nr:hypothetical protein [Adiantum nelumboides]
MPPPMPCPLAQAHAFLGSYTQPQFTMQASQNFGSPLAPSANFRPSLQHTFTSSPIPLHPPIQPEIQTHDNISDDNYVPSLDGQAQNNGNACTRVEVEQSKMPSRKRISAKKEKSQQKEAACKKQTKAKERRQKLADGDTSTFRFHWSMDDFRVLAMPRRVWTRRWQRKRSFNERWRQVSNWCKTAKVNKSALQCRDKWENTFPKYKKVRDWDRAMPSRKNSYALMTVDERVKGGSPKTFDNAMYNILESRFARDILVDPGPIWIDALVETLEQLNSTTTSAGTSSVLLDPASSPTAPDDTLQSENPRADPSSTCQKESRWWKQDDQCEELSPGP